MNRNTLEIAVAFAALSFVAGSAQAGSITVGFNGGPGVTAYYGGLNGAGGTAVGTAAGSFTVTPTGLPPLTDGLPFVTFCVDLQHFMNAADATLNTMANWNLLAGATADQKKAASYLFRTRTGTDDAARQVAIWEVLYERQFVVPFNTWTVAGGSTYFSDASLMTAAEGLIKGINTGSANFSYAGLLEVKDNGNVSQDYMWDCDGCSIPTPDPMSSLAALGLGILSLASLKRRLRK